jgi:hypothetical protein
MLFVRAYPRETQEMVFDAHNRAFAFFKGAFMPVGGAAALTFDILPFGCPPWHGRRPSTNQDEARTTFDEMHQATC